MMIRRFCSILTMVSLAANANAEGSVAVKINKAMVVNETGSGDAMLWFDEQDISAKPTTRWKTAGNTNCWPAGLVIDLGRDYLIESISLFDLQKAYRAEGGRLEIAVGKPFAWTTVASPTMENNSKWRVIAIGKRTRYLHLVKHATAMCNLEGEFPVADRFPDQNGKINRTESLLFDRREFFVGKRFFHFAVQFPPVGPL